jgi:hypothetical protein
MGQSGAAGWPGGVMGYGARSNVCSFPCIEISFGYVFMYGAKEVSL